MSDEDEQRAARVRAATAKLVRIVQATSLQRTREQMLRETNHSISGEGLRVALKRAAEKTEMSDALLSAAEQMTEPDVPVVSDHVAFEAYPNRRAAMPLIRKYVSPEVAESMESMTLKSDSGDLTVEDWVARALELERKSRSWEAEAARIRALGPAVEVRPQTPDEDPDAPIVSGGNLTKRKKKGS